MNTNPRTPVKATEGSVPHRRTLGEDIREYFGSPKTPESAHRRRVGAGVLVAFALTGSFAGGIAAERAGVPEATEAGIVDIFDGPEFSPESVPFQVDTQRSIADVVSAAYGGVDSANLQPAINDFVERNKDGACAAGVCNEGFVGSGTVLVAANADW